MVQVCVYSYLHTSTYRTLESSRRTGKLSKEVLLTRKKQNVFDGVKAEKRSK